MKSSIQNFVQETPSKRQNNNNNNITQNSYYYNNFTFADNKSPKDTLSTSDNNNNNNSSNNYIYIPHNNNDSNNSNYNNQLHLIQMYQDEIIKLKTKNISLRQENEMLNNELHSKSTQEESHYLLLSELCSLLNINSIDLILPKLIALLNTNTNNKLKDEFICKVRLLYSELTGNESNANIKQLWEWLRTLIQTLKDIMIKNNNNQSSLPKHNNNNSNKSYMECCNKLVNEYEFKNITEMKYYINEQLLKHNMNNNHLYIYNNISSNSNNTYSN